MPVCRSSQRALFKSSPLTIYRLCRCCILLFTNDTVYFTDIVITEIDRVKCLEMERVFQLQCERRKKKHWQGIEKPNANALTTVNSSKLVDHEVIQFNAYVFVRFRYNVSKGAKHRLCILLLLLYPLISIYTLFRNILLKKCSLW